MREVSLVGRDILKHFIILIRVSSVGVLEVSIFIRLLFVFIVLVWVRTLHWVEVRESSHYLLHVHFIVLVIVIIIHVILSRLLASQISVVGIIDFLQFLFNIVGPSFNCFKISLDFFLINIFLEEIWHFCNYCHIAMSDHLLRFMDIVWIVDGKWHYCCSNIAFGQ